MIARSSTAASAACSRRCSEQGLDDNTLVIFTSDNGGANYHRPAGDQSAVPRLEADLLRGRHARAVLRAVAGTHRAGHALRRTGRDTSTSAARRGRGCWRKLPDDRPIDGVDLLPYVAGNAAANRTYAVLARGLLPGGAHDGWKLIVTERPDKQWLFHFNDDPTEQQTSRARTGEGGPAARCSTRTTPSRPRRCGRASSNRRC